MRRLIDTLEKLSEATSEALQLLESYDYSQEAADYKNTKLQLSMTPKTLQEILDGLLMYCAPISYKGERLDDNELLDKENMEIFKDNLELCGDVSVLKPLNFIGISPIEKVCDLLERMGVAKPARLLKNVCCFAHAMRSYSRSKSLRPTAERTSPIRIEFTLSREEMTSSEEKQAEQFAQFNSIFKPDSLNSAQRKSLYNSFQDYLSDKSNENPHLVILAALILLRKRPLYCSPIKGSFHTTRKKVFLSLGMDEETGKSYKETSLKNGVTPSLIKHKDKAQELLKQALRTTR